MTLPLIPETGLFGREGKPFIAEKSLIDTANAAWMLGIPLLLTGEPGCGKTDFAFAIARWWSKARNQAWKRAEMLQATIRSDTKARDLLYSYDAVRRFADAQAGAKDKAGEVRRYIELAALGRALDAPSREVVLIDEIDKAPRDLPNDILRELDQGVFDIPEISPEVQREKGPGATTHLGLQRAMGRADRPIADKPFVIITSNAERQLPTAFLRRCVFFYLHPPGEDRLDHILEGWFQRPGPGGTLVSGIDPDLKTAAKETYELLRKANLRKKPTTSELIQWVDVVQNGHGVSAEERERVRQGPVDLATLPALGVLLKIPEDQNAVGARVYAPV